MTDAVSIGDDGNPPGDDDGPLLAALKTWFAGIHHEALAAMEERRLQALQALYLASPQAVPVQNSGSVPASGTLVIDLGAPQIGRRWVVRRLAVASAAGATGTLAGRADWYVGSAASVANPAAWQATMPALPAVQLVSSEAIPITPGDHLFCVISTGTANQVPVASATILDYPADASAGPALQVI